jgi:ATP/maltotriose-dependent transcriptional regulator MalT
MTRRRITALGLLLAALLSWLAPDIWADECPERIEEAQALIAQAEQRMAAAPAGVDRAALHDKLTQARALVAEAQALHAANQHDASVDKAYAALASVKEVLQTLNP